MVKINFFLTSSLMSTAVSSRGVKHEIVSFFWVLFSFAFSQKMFFSSLLYCWSVVFSVFYGLAFTIQYKS